MTKPRRAAGSVMTVIRGLVRVLESPQEPQSGGVLLIAVPGKDQLAPLLGL